MYALYFMTKQLGEGIKRISEVQMVSEFLIEGSEKALLIDTGYGFFNVSKHVKGLTDKPLIVMNSHFHMDHSGGNYRFKEVYIGKKDMPFEKSLAYDNLFDDITGALEKKHPSVKKLLNPLINKVFVVKKGDTVYHPLHDGDTFDLGGRELVVRDLPGHTDGSMVILDNATKTVFTCDACNMATWLFTNPEMTLSQYSKNLRALSESLSPGDYKWFRCSHVPIKNKFSFLLDYADFIDGIKPGGETAKFNLIGCDSPLCIKVKPSLKHMMMACFYFEKQTGKDIVQKPCNPDRVNAF